MEIPYTVRPRPDTGLANPKLGIWLFIASEVMLFGGLFAGYIFMRLGAEPWMWPHGWLNVPVGTFNTFVLIASSVTVILSWEALKMRNYKAFKTWLAITWICGLAFLAVKLSIEWPAKFSHFGAYIQKDAIAKYEAYLGNVDVLDEHGKVAKEGRVSRGQPERRFISGHARDLKLANQPLVKPEILSAIVGLDANETGAQQEKLQAKRITLLKNLQITDAEIADMFREGMTPEQSKAEQASVLKRLNTIVVESLDEENAPEHDPTSPEHDKPHFIPRGLVHLHAGHELELNKADLIPGHGSFYPRLNTYLACYFMITGLHGLHVLGGVLVFLYFWGPGSKLFKTNPEQLCNRIEVSGLFWHLVDLIWIFVFPIFYLL